jgi:hypothetical protein
MFDSSARILPQEQFRYMLEQECKRAERYECLFSVIRVSCETINLGPPIMQEVAKLIRKVIRDSDVVGLTQNGDLSLLLQYADHQCAAQVASRIHDQVANPLRRNLKKKAIRIEWACFPTHASTIEDLIGTVQYR